MRQILLTVFEPFGGRALNASQEVARALRPVVFEGAQLEVVELPVERFAAPKIALEAIMSVQPDIVILLGEAGGRAAITPERVAINLDDFPIPDNAGNQPRETATIEGGPVAYFSTLPLLAIQAALESENLAAAISNTAGTYLCNHLFYRVMHHLAQTDNPAQAGFIHLPVLPVPAALNTKEQPILTPERVQRGVRIAIETCLQLGQTPRNSSD